MTTLETLQRELTALKQRVDLAETRLSQVEGRFEFVSGQLRDMQLYNHAKFGEIDAHFERVDARFAKVDARLDGIDRRLDDLTAEVREVKAEVRAIPRAVAELLGKR